MRILANYGYKNNGDSYSVTFETLGDVPRDMADSVVDDLFKMAKSAIQRQINPEIRIDDKPHKEDVVIPDPKQTNGKTVSGNGKHANGNGKPAMKDPEAPITQKQKSLIIKLAKERDQFIEGLSTMNMQDASHVIEDLLAVTV